MDWNCTPARHYRAGRGECSEDLWRALPRPAAIAAVFLAHRTTGVKTQSRRVPTCLECRTERATCVLLGFGPSERDFQAAAHRRSVQTSAGTNQPKKTGWTVLHRVCVWARVYRGIFLAPFLLYASSHTSMRWLQCNAEMREYSFMISSRSLTTPFASGQ